ncbi:MAG: isoprenylcysteine carboxylmethyltransferase family protein [Paracoccaceae bacterium]
MTQSAPQIAVFPPLAAMIAAVGAVVMEWMAPLNLLPSGWFAMTLPGVALFVLSVAFPVAGARAFKQADTNVDPRKPALNLVLSGPYKFTRNPMYLGMVLFQLALALTFAIDWALITAVALWAVLHFGVVLREEAYLTDIFGQPYTDYLGQTRRWL